MPHPYWLNKAELEQIKGPQGQKPIAAQTFVTGPRAHRKKRLNVLYSDGLIEMAHPKQSWESKEAVSRTEFLVQIARRAGLQHRLHQAAGPECPHCGLPLRLCLEFLQDNAQTQRDIPVECS